MRCNSYWSRLIPQVSEYVDKCLVRNSRNVRANRTPMQVTDMPRACMQKITIDCSSPYSSTERGMEFIVISLFEYSGWAECFVTPDIKSLTLANLLVNHFITRHGVPLAIITDNGQEFCGKQFQQVVKKYHIHHVNTKPYHLQAKGSDSLQHIH